MASETRVDLVALRRARRKQGDALYMRSSDGQVGKAIANDTLDKAYVVGIADTAKATGEEVKVLVTGVEAMTGLDAGDHYFLSASSAGAITTTAPTGAGNYVVRLGEATSTTEFAIQLEPPILLS